MRKYKIIYLKSALYSLKKIISFIANVSNESARKEYLVIKETIQNLEYFPNRFPFIKGMRLFKLKVHRLVTKNGKYVIIYTIDEKTVLINDIIDCRMDSKLFNDISNNQS